MNKNSFITVTTNERNNFKMIEITSNWKKNSVFPLNIIVLSPFLNLALALGFDAYHMPPLHKNEHSWERQLTERGEKMSACRLTAQCVRYICIWAFMSRGCQKRNSASGLSSSHAWTNPNDTNSNTSKCSTLLCGWFTAAGVVNSRMLYNLGECALITQLTIHSNAECESLSCVCLLLKGVQ